MDTALIHRLAREAGMTVHTQYYTGSGLLLAGPSAVDDACIRFAALVAEECAKVAEAGIPHARSPREIAQAIRTRFANPNAGQD